MKPMDVNFLTSLQEFSLQDWNMLTGLDYPFLRYEFLSALEQSGAVAPQTGWQPHHLLITSNDEPTAVMPLYLKSHSRGEYVFDHAWAQAYAQYGQAYYPKLLTSIPFTPCCGPRLAVAAGANTADVFNRAFNALTDFSIQHDLSSWHCLFPNADLGDLCQSLGLIQREDIQFQWFNRDYRCFDDFLNTLTASKRKMIKRERRKVGEQGIRLIQVNGKQVTNKQWQAFYRFYALTYLKRRSQPYLNLDFFLRLAETMPEQLQLILAIKHNEPIAAALFFVGSDTLFGRYWGCEQDYDALHFEACYYQGIEYCIEHGLQRFDSGAQGEHKIARGFEPVSTHSAHWIRDARFSRAIADFVDREQQYVKRYKSDASAYLPFKQNIELHDD